MPVNTTAIQLGHTGISVPPTTIVQLPTHLDLAISGAVSGTMVVTSNETGQRVELKTVGSGLGGVIINLVR
jgi:hypothetical protein